MADKMVAGQLTAGSGADGPPPEVPPLMKYHVPTRPQAAQWEHGQRPRSLLSHAHRCSELFPLIGQCPPELHLLPR